MKTFHINLNLKTNRENNTLITGLCKKEIKMMLKNMDYNIRYFNRNINLHSLRRGGVILQ